MILHTTSFPKLGLLIADEDDLEDFLEIINIDSLNIEHNLLETKVTHKKVKRITYFGATIGFIMNDKKYIALKYQDIYQELNKE